MAPARPIAEISLPPCLRPGALIAAPRTRRALVGVRAVINAVGPFDYDPALRVTTCLEGGCDYMDIAATPAFIAAAQ
jgi:short subunit dehydrogenase-like uncharacterized protein